MSRLCPMVKTSEALPVYAGVMAANRPDSATSPGILSPAWASASHLLKVTAVLAVTSPRFCVRSRPEGH